MAETKLEKDCETQKDKYSSSQSAILQLPVEILEIIFRTVFATKPHFYSTDTSGKRSSEKTRPKQHARKKNRCAALLVCRKFYEEGVRLLYGLNMFNTARFVYDWYGAGAWWDSYPPWRVVQLVHFRQKIGEQNWLRIQHIHLDGDHATEFFTKIALKWILLKNASIVDLATTPSDERHVICQVLLLPRLRSVRIPQIRDAGSWPSAGMIDFDESQKRLALNPLFRAHSLDIIKVARCILAARISKSYMLILICVGAIMARREKMDPRLASLKAFKVQERSKKQEHKQSKRKEPKISKEHEFLIIKGDHPGPIPDSWTRYDLVAEERMLHERKQWLHKQYASKVPLDRNTVEEILFEAKEWKCRRGPLQDSDYLSLT